MRRAPIRNLRTSLLFIAALLCLASASLGACPSDPPPPSCDIDGQLLGGRWGLSDLTGSYFFSGAEAFWPFPPPEPLVDDYDPVAGSLVVQAVGGDAENYLDVACDGTVTGQAHERITGTLAKSPDVWYYDPDTCVGEPQTMQWSVTFERTVSITGEVTGVGQVDLDLDVHTATIDVVGNFAWSYDCIFESDSFEVLDFDVSGDVESIRLAGSYDPITSSWQPWVTDLGARSWVDDIAHRLKINGYNFDHPSTVNPILRPPGSTQPAIQEYNLFFVQDGVSVMRTLQADAVPMTPVVTSLVLQEPSQYLGDVPVDTTVVATVDWRGEPPGEVEFTYGATMETLPGAETVTWTFDAGEPGTSIEAVAVNGAERSLPYVIVTPKVAVPGWAGTTADWSGSSGVRYDATLDWPVSLETTRTLDTLSLFSGLWGISGSAASEFDALAFSSGSPGAGTMTTDAALHYAGKEWTFHMEGPNATTLACEDLTTTGSATTAVPVANWQRTINPLTLIPGLESAACGLSGWLCSAIQSVGIKATAGATLSGTGTYTGEGAQILWDGGSIGGTITARISAGATLPPPLSKVAGVSIYGGTTGCLELQVAPAFDLTTLGGALEAGAEAHFFGLAASASESWPFGDDCGGGAFGEGAATGFVPADGQLAMAATDDGGELVGIAVWSELPAGQSRPSGDIHYRWFQEGSWGPILTLTDDADSDVAPTVELDAAGNALIVYQRSEATLPSGTGDLPSFANGYELHFAVVDPQTGLPTATGSNTTNGSNDFGPRLRRDAGGGLHLFWQRANGVEITGTTTDPVAILVSSWNPADSSWGAEVSAADGLTDTFGWSPAAFSQDEMLIGLVVDTDQDFATADDRELFQITRAAGTWLQPIQVTSDSVADDAPQAGFDVAGEPILLWRAGSSALELRGDLTAAPSVAFTTADPTLDDGVGLELAHGALASAAEGETLVWPEGTELLLTSRLASAPGPGWRTPSAPAPGAEAQTLHALRIAGTELLLGYATQAFESGNTALSPLLEPHFVRLPLRPEIFADGFETGGTDAWSSTTP